MSSNLTDKIAEIIIHHLDGSVTIDEQKELHDWMKLSPENEEAVAEFLDEKKLQTGIKDMYQYRQKVWSVVQRQVNATKIVSLDFSLTHRKIRWLRYAAAVAIFLVLGFGSYYLFFNKTEKKNDLAKNNTPADVEAPKVTKAMITLANGRQISLDSLTSIDQSNVTITKSADGKIVYAGSSSEVVYNTLSNPRGSKVIDMTLSDGSHVWLNSGSSVTYPVAFVGKERKVEIDGEAYFEISHDGSKPFTVSKGETTVQVLGTHFNVNAYADEADIKVTLLEGSVEIKNKNSKLKIRPGQQAISNGQLTINNSVNVDAVMAWKNGTFTFGNANIKTIMREIARWYDVEVEYAGSITETFRVDINRNTNVSNVFKILEETGKVHFKIEGRKITVLP